MYISFFENIGHKYDFEGGGVVPGRGTQGGGWSSSKETNLFYQINSYLLTMYIYNNFPIK